MNGRRRTLLGMLAAAGWMSAGNMAMAGTGLHDAAAANDGARIKALLASRTRSMHVTRTIERRSSSPRMPMRLRPLPC